MGVEPPSAPVGSHQNSQDGEIHRRGPGKRRTPVVRKLFAEALLAPQERVVWEPPAPGKKRRRKVVQVVEAAMLKDLLARIQEIAADPRVKNRPQVLMLLGKFYDVFDAVVDAAERKEGGYGPEMHVTNLVLTGPAAERLAREQLKERGIELPDEATGRAGDGPVAHATAARRRRQ